MKSFIKIISQIYSITFKGALVLFFSSAFLLYITNFILIKYGSINLVWIDPLVQYLFVISGLMGAAVAVQNNENIKIELFKKLSSKKVFVILKNGVASFISLIMLIIFINHCLTEIRRGGRHISIGIQNWIFDLPYLYLFLVSTVFYLISAISTVFPNTIDSKNKETE